VAASSPGALDAWILATAPRAVAYARSLLRDPHQAEDVVHDCYCRLLAKADTYDLPRDGLKLLFRSITNACINAKTRRRTMFRLVHSDDDDSPDDPIDTTALPPDALLMGRELEKFVADGLAKLPEAQRAALELRVLGHTQQEVAEILGVTATHAGVLIFRARKSLTAFLGPYLQSEAPP